MIDGLDRELGELLAGGVPGTGDRQPPPAGVRVGAFTCCPHCSVDVAEHDKCQGCPLANPAKASSLKRFARA